MAEEGSISLRPRGFTPYHSFIINLPHLGFGELGIPPQTKALVCDCVLQFMDMGGLSLAAVKKKKKNEREGEREKEIPQFTRQEKSIVYI